MSQVWEIVLYACDQCFWWFLWFAGIHKAEQNDMFFFFVLFYAMNFIYNSTPLYNTLCYITLQYITLHCNMLHYIALHYIALQKSILKLDSSWLPNTLIITLPTVHIIDLYNFPKDFKIPYAVSHKVDYWLRIHFSLWMLSVCSEGQLSTQWLQCIIA